MKYNEANLTYPAFIKMLKDENESFDDSNESLSLQDISDSALSTGFPDNPSFYYFSNVDGQQYVLEENESLNCSLVYKVSDIDADTSPCEYILRATVGSWDGDTAENLVIYGLDPKMPNADENDVDVRVWVSFIYSSTTNNAPLDRYVRGVDVDQESDDYDAYEFATYKDAQEWIAKQESGKYILSYGEMGRPTYNIVSS